MNALWKRRRLVLNLTLCLVVVLFATVVVRAYVFPALTAPNAPQTLAATATPVVHSTYLFSLDGFPSGVRAGQRLSLRWEPSIQPRTSPADIATTPVAVVCAFALYGPYGSATSARQAIEAQRLLSERPATQPAFAAPPLSLTDWESQPQQVDATLPTTLRPGFYAVIALSTRALDGSLEGSGYVTQIAS